MQELWKPVPGFEGLYEVSNCGQVKSLTRNTTHNRILKPSPRQKIRRGNGRKQGEYPNHKYVSLSKDGHVVRRAVHRLVLEALVGPKPKGKQCRHLNGIADDNRWPENICWGTAKEDSDDKRRHGRVASGVTQITSAKITRQQADVIFNMIGLHNDIAERFGISPATVSDIKCNRTWRR